MASELLKKLPEIKELPDFRKKIDIDMCDHTLHHFEGAPLRALRVFLDEVDPQKQYGGLRKVLTPEGHYLWLCEYHAAQYRKVR